MSKGAINFSTDNEYYTPKEIVSMFGNFDYDPATTEGKAKDLGISNFDTIETLQRVTFAGNGKEVVKGKIYEGKFNYSKWHTYCKECARKLTTKKGNSQP